MQIRAPLPVKAASGSAIENHLRTVIDNIDNFQNVKIDVNDCVVRLSGTTPRMEASEMIAQLVSRFEGVNYVDNQIQMETASELILMTLEGNHVRIPNATVFKSFIYNYSINPRRRFDFAVGVGVNVDLVDVREHGCGVLQQMKGVMVDPAPFMIVENLGDYNVLVRFFGWIDQPTADFAKVRGEAIRLVKLALDEGGIDMPEPIQTLRLQQVAAAPSEATATPEPPAQSAAERETETVDVSPDTQLDEQIREDLSDTREPNLLIET